MIIFKKFINFIFFKPERLFMFLPPLNYPSEVRYIYILRNFLIYFKIKKWKKSFLMIIKGIEKLFFDILKILYFPFSVIVFFTKYRFIQPNYVQIGTVANHLCMMTKYQLIKNKIPIIFIPKHYNYSFITKIFKKNPKIIFVDSLILSSQSPSRRSEEHELIKKTLKIKIITLLIIEVNMYVHFGQI